MIPMHLKLNNFLSHSSSEIDFTKFNIALILGNYHGDTESSNGSGKCLSSSSFLRHAITGEGITVKDLHESGRKDFYISGLDENLKLIATRIIATQKSGVKDLLKITMADGSEEIVSKDHPILSCNLTTIPAKDIKVGYKIAQPRKLNYNILNDKITKDEAIILATYLAEISVSGAIKSLPIRRLEKTAYFKGLSFNNYNKFLNTHGFLGKLSVQKELPKVIYESSDDIVGQFLGVFISCIGYISDMEKEISIESDSKKLICDFQSLLKQRGLSTKIRHNKLANKNFDNWILTINSNQDNILRFKELCGNYIYGVKKQKFEKMFHMVMSEKYNPISDLIPNELTLPILKNYRDMSNRKNIDGVIKHQYHDLSRDSVLRYYNSTKDGRLKALAESDIFWGKVKKIEEVGRGETYDIQIDNKTSLYALNGFITHNSSILNAFSYALFNKGRGRKIDDTIKHGEKFCSVEFTFQLDGAIYKVVRKRDKLIAQSNLQLFQEQNGHFVNISADTTKLTEEKLHSLIKLNYDVFINSVYFKQGDVDIFTNATPAKRKDILKSLLSLEKWDAYYKKVRDIHKSISISMAELNSQLLSMSQINEEIDSGNKRLIEIENIIAKINQDQEITNDHLLNLQKEFSSTHGDVIDVPKKIAELEKEKFGIEMRKEEIQILSNKLQENIKSNEAELIEIKKKIEKIKNRIKAKEGIDLPSLREKLHSGKTKAKLLQAKIDELQKDIDFEEECLYCFNKIEHDNISHIKERRSEEANKYIKEYEVLNAKIEKAEAKFKELTNTVADGNNALLEKGKLELLVNKIENSNISEAKEIVLLKEEYGQISCIDIDEEIIKLKATLNEEDANTLKEKILELKQLINNNNLTKDKLNIEKGIIINSIKELELKKEDQNNLQKRILELSKKLSVYEKLKVAFGKDGIQSLIIESIIDELSYHTNQTLSKICNDPTNVIINMQKTNDFGNSVETFDIDVAMNGKVCDIELLSGGEKFRVSLALRLAMSKILAKRMGGEIKFLLLDEVSSSLDKKGVQIFVNIIKNLSNEMKILLISHDEAVKENFDDIILVNKDNSGSTITQ